MLRQRHLTTDSLGCHLGKLVARRGPGYSSVHYNTKEGKRYNIDLHHLAFVALGEHEKLKQGNDLWQVSHLCNNGRCFNHEHLVIEERSDNLVSPDKAKSWTSFADSRQARTSCRDNNIIVHNGWTYNPCPHWKLSAGRLCVLPTREYNGEVGYRRNDD
jgi:hypothetical protein